MADKKTEQIKLVIVFVLALVLVFVVYLRFIRPKAQRTASEEAAPVPTASLEVPEVALEVLEALKRKQRPRKRKE